MNTRTRRNRPVVIRVTIENVQPLTGTMASASGEKARFEGWLGLLGVLSDLVGSASPPHGPQKIVPVAPVD